MTLLHRQIQDMRVLRLIKKYLKSGVMENGVICKTEEGSPQGGPLSPLLANIYLNEFDWEMHSRGVKLVRYADDKKQTRSRASVGILPEVSGRQAEAENEHGKEQGDQYLRTEELQVSWILSEQERKRHLYPCAPKVSE